MITVEQIRGARAMLGLKQKELSKRAGVSTGTLNNIERGVQTDPKISTLRSIQNALEREGIAFTSDAAGSVGVLMAPQNKDVEHAKILIIDDNKADRMLYSGWLKTTEDAGYNIFESVNAEEALGTYAEHEPDCIILDFMMFGTNGFQLLAMLEAKERELPPIIFVTGSVDKELKKDAEASGVFRYFNKQELTRGVLNEAVECALLL